VGAFPPAPVAQKLLARVAALALGGVLLHGLARFAYKGILYLRSPYSRDYGEGFVLTIVQFLDERGNYFMNMREYPFVHLNYPPVFPLLVWPFHHWLGPTLAVPRLLSLMATGGIVAVVYGLVRRLEGNRPFALAMAGIALCPWFLQTWAPLARVDMLAVFFSLFGLLAFVSGARLWAVFALFWLGFFTKQNALLAPAAVLLSLLSTSPWRRFVKAALGFTVPLALLFGGLTAATGGEAHRHLVTYTAAAHFDFSRLTEGYVELARVAWPLLGVIALAAVRHPRALASGPKAVMGIYWILNAFALVTIAKEGALHNYVIEPWLATVILAAIAMPPALDGLARGDLARVAALLVAALAAHYTKNWAHEVPRAIHRPHDQGYARLWDAVRDTEGPILSENLAALVVNGKPVLVEPFGLLSLSRAGLLRTRKVVRDCEAGRFRLVVLESLFERVPSLNECLVSRYRVVEEVPPYRLLRPMSAAEEP